MSGSAEGVEGFPQLWVHFERAGNAVRWYFRRQFPGREEEANDLAQETLLAAWHSLRNRDPASIGDLVAYILGVARHKVRDTLRASARERRSMRELRARHEEMEVSSPPEALRLIERRDDVRRLRVLLSRCSPLERRLLVLRFVAGLPHCRACAAAGIDPANGSRVLYRARRKLRSLWQIESNAEDASRHPFAAAR